MTKLITDPFPHIVLNDAFPPSDAYDLMKFFPEPDEDWYKYENCFETKFATDKASKIPNLHKGVISGLNSSYHLTTLENVFSIDGLIPDPHLRGGGLHCIKNGGKLDIHADFNIHPKLKLQRRLNVILYLNKDWKPEYGGELQLWDRDLTRPTIIEPIFNRLVAFEISDTSFHGHPTPWNAPYPRRSIATYYYTVPKVGVQPHSTLYQKLPGAVTSDEVEEFRVKRGNGRI